MKLVHPDIDIPIDFETCHCYNLIVENPKAFFSLTKDIIDQANGNDGDFILSKNSKILDIDKNCLVLYDFFNISFSSKKIVNLISNSVLDLLKAKDFIEDFANINQQFILLNEKVSRELDFPIEFEDEFSYDSFVKFSNYKISPSKNLAERIFDYVNLYYKIVGISTVIFVNLNLFLPQKDIEALVKQLSYMQLNILFVDAVDILTIKDCKKIIIDNDLCVI